MFNFTTVLTNVKPPKSTTPELELTPTKGNFRINPAALRLMGLNIEDRVTIIGGEDAESGEAVFGIALVPETMEGVGAKLGSQTGKAGGSLQFSSANVYQEMKGDESKRTYFTVSETAVTGHPDFAKIYPLEFSRVEDKTIRKSAGSADEGEDEGED